MPTKSDTHKKALLEALNKSMGNVTLACKNVGIARSTYYDWLEKDLQFKKDVDEICEVQLDFVESKLFNAIDKENITAIIFYMKCKGKNRGYVERQEIVNRVDIESDLMNLSDEQLQERLNELRSAYQN